ncbi:hypothetical protein [Acetobacter aceti]|uniref:hypothetical protein n=1 Tax=Acetobacter aceti TaxID=435 RepID=UPI0038CFAC26
MPDLVDQTMKQWHTRSRHTDWQCDIFWAIKTYSVVPIKYGETLARELNRKFVQQAQTRVGIRTGRCTVARSWPAGSDPGQTEANDG